MKRGRLTKTTTDLFPISAVKKVLAPLTSQMTVPEAPAPRHVLPKDLPTAIKQLDDQEFERLVAAVRGEQKRRGKRKPAKAETGDKPASGSLSVGKINAIRAAFQAGVTSSRIARQFGVSQADVRLVLSSNSSKG
jgi:hypothetical protein